MKEPRTGEQVIRKTLQEGETFGEVALLYDAVRTASVTALDDVTVYQLDGNIFKKIIVESTL